MDSTEIKGIDPERARALRARAAFKGFLGEVGINLVVGAMKEAERQQEIGLRGLTMPTEDHSIMLAVDANRVSFSIGDWQDQVPLDTAIAAIAEMRAEAESQP